MKAISFLEYFNQVNIDKLNDDKFSEEKINLTGSSLLHSKNLHYNNSFEFLNVYYKLVSQSFSFEKVVELFEGFELDKRYLKYSPVRFSTDEITIFVDMNYNAGLSSELWSFDVIPKTIDEFIVLCNNLNIELQWKNQEV